MNFAYQVMLFCKSITGEWHAQVLKGELCWFISVTANSYTYCAFEDVMSSFDFCRFTLEPEICP
jgi:hypothetical protein